MLTKSLSTLLPHHSQLYNSLTKQPLYLKMMKTFSVSHPLISSMIEVKQGYRFLKDNNFKLASEQLTNALNILPSTYNDQLFKTDEIDIINNLIKCHVWLAQVDKLQSLTSRIEQSIKQIQHIPVNPEVSHNMAVINTILQQRQQKNLELINKNIKSLLTGKTIEQPIQKLLTKSSTSPTSAVIQIEQWLQQNHKIVFGNIITSLLVDCSFSNNANYNNLCNKFLKQCEKTDQNNLVKALTILIINLIKKQQYLQAQGMVRYCIDLKQQNIKKQVLHSNQQYIILNLLLSQIYRKVKRQPEAITLQNQYRLEFNLPILLLQILINDSK